MTLFCRETLFCEVCFSPEEKELCLTWWCQPTAAVCLQGARMGRNGGAELEPQSAVRIFLWGAEMKPQLPEKMAQAVSKEKVGNQRLIHWASFCSDGTACFPLILLLTSCPMLSGPGTQLPINDVSHNPVLFADAWSFPWGCKAQHREWEVTSHWFGSSLQLKDSICGPELFAWSPQCLESRWWKRVTSLWRFHVLRQECRTSITGSRNSHTLKWAGKKSTQGGVGPELRQTLLHLLTPRWGDVVLPQKGEKQWVNRGCCRDLWRNPTSCPSGT